jgi:hypothetical protein
MSQPVQGPDGKLYQFPDGTTKEMAVRYFQSKGVSKEPEKPTASVRAYPPITSKAGLKMRGYHVAEKGLESLPTIGCILGGLLGSSVGSVEPGGGSVVGGLVGSGAGGGAGKIFQKQGRELIFGDKPDTPGTEVKDVGWEALKQSGYELFGRALGAVGGRMFARTGEKAGEEIGGVKIPETMGQMYGKTGGLMQQVEHYTRGTFVGGPLKNIHDAQETAARAIVNKLSGSSEGLSMAENWARAREATRIMASPLYESLVEIPAKGGGSVASSVLTDESLRLSAKAKTALTKAAGYSDLNPMIRTANATAKGLGYKSWDKWAEKEGLERVLQYFPKDMQEALRGSETKVGDLLEARSELAKQASSVADAAERSRLWDAVEQINDAIDKSLKPEQLLVKREADKLWRRSYIMDTVQEELGKMEASQDPLKQKRVAVDAFVRLVNDLAETPISREGSTIVTRASKLDVLFDSPQDRQAMKQLASFLKSKYSRLGGESGPAESFARIGLIFDVVGSVGTLLAGHPGTAAAAVSPVAGLYAVAKVLSDPGGAQRLLAAFRGTPGAIGATATKAAGFGAEQTGQTQ